ncbi:hypothetical protein HJFPF1_03628 [Paramyrothecium foliicola]|nr:hypothetical protein HJFPF1_03628 [Paramyrothecium foliicola]
MCLPCFPWTWTEFEDPLDSLPEQSVWVPHGNSWALQKVPGFEPVNTRAWLWALHVFFPYLKTFVAFNPFSLLSPLWSPPSFYPLSPSKHPKRPAMPEAAADQKSPKTPRRLKTGGEPPRQVHFATVEDANEQGSININGTTRSRGQSLSSNQPTGIKTGADTVSATGTNNNNNNNNNEAINTQPTSFPQVGLPPGYITAAGTQWHTVADPSRTLPLPGQPQTLAGCFASGFIQQPQHNVGLLASHQLPGGPVTYISPTSPLPHPATAPPPVTYIGVHPQHPPQQHQPVGNMGDYQNTVPPPTGLNFQPPVPDTTFGPMQHVYVPRFDGGFVPGVHVGLPPMQRVLPPASLPPALPQACTRVVVPNVLCYVYYASGPLLPVSTLCCIRNVHARGSAQAMFPLPSGKEDRCAAPTSRFQPAVGGVSVNQPGYVVAQQPAFVQQQPVLTQQPIMMSGQPFVAQGTHQLQAVPAAGLAGGLAMGPGTGVSIIAGNASHIPDISGIGRTTGEEGLRQIKFAHANKMFEPQEFKPADDDPSRFYYVREVDGNWTQRNRFTIDRMGDCRWYVTDEGWFYAVRLPD